MGLCLTLSACSGVVTDPPPTRSGPDIRPVEERVTDPERWPDLSAADPPTVRRLTHEEFDYVASDLLGVERTLSAIFPADRAVLGWENNGAALNFTPPYAELSFAAAEQLGEAALSEGARFAPCIGAAPPSAGEQADCAATFARQFGRRAWGRPLTAEEEAQFSALFAMGTSQEGFARGIEMVATAISYAFPYFYRVEVGDGSEVDGDPLRTRPTDYEMASRLSFLYWMSRPDDVLLDAAGAGELRTPEQILAQAERLLDDPRAERSIASFHRQWLHIDGIAGVNKDPETFPDWSVELPLLLGEEMERFFSELPFRGEATFGDVFTTTDGYVNADLASYYGIDPVDGDELIKVSLDPATRSGVLTRGGFLALEGFAQTSPVLRGHFIREHFLCDQVPPPPPDVDDVPPPPTPDDTTRARIEARTGTGQCAGCHQLMNGLGYGFEAYDAMGMYRTEENGFAIDDSGTAVESDIGPFEGAVEFQARLAESPQARGCFARQWFRFAYGRSDSVDEFDVLLELDRVLEESEGSYRALLLALSQTDAFLTLRRSPH
ncbi:MAG: DUF1592 domain-containing protein [Myxococcota bacterium]